MANNPIEAAAKRYYEMSGAGGTQSWEAHKNRHPAAAAIRMENMQRAIQAYEEAKKEEPGR